MELTDNALAADIERLEALLDAFNAKATGIANARAISILLKGDDDELHAGIHAHTWSETCFIKLLWIDEADRKRGLGSTLLAAVEVEAIRRGCRQLMLWTHSFQAPDFYARHGFEQLVTVPDNPVGHTDILMVKRLPL
jgi:N-acetylglutamate synthase-like GNAT family acetyltransferase